MDRSGWGGEVIGKTFQNNNDDDNDDIDFVFT